MKTKKITLLGVLLSLILYRETQVPLLRYGAALALEKGVEAHEVDVRQVRAKILENNGILTRP